MLFERNYCKITKEEKKVWDEVEKKWGWRKDGTTTPKRIINYWKKLPLAVIHYKTLFPNYYLNINELKEKEKVKEVQAKFEKLINNEKILERDILNFISVEKAYFIIGSIFSKYRFGHHSAFLFKEFPLGTNYVVDYLLVGKNSHGYNFVFIELEAVNGSITTKKNEFGSVIRKGLNQISLWDTWIDSNFFSLKSEFKKHLGELEPLPSEFYDLDKSRINYAIVAGKRDNFKSEANRERRKLEKEKGILLLHYNNLLEGIDTLLSAKNY